MEHLIIPTLGRIHQQKTYNNLPEKWKAKVKFTVQPHEVDEMRDIYGDKVLPLPESIKGLSPTRQWIWDEFYGTKHMVLDDDMEYFKYKGPAPEHLDTKWETRDMTNSEFDDAFDTFNKWMDEEQIYHGGFSTSWVVPDLKYWPHQNNVRIMTNCYFDSKNLPRNIVWDKLQTSQDFHANLQLLTQGYANRITTRYRVSIAATNAAGGCSEYRTIEVSNRVHQQLAEMYPDYVSLRTKTTVNGPWKGQERITCHISWAKAYKDAIKAKESNSLEDFLG